MGLDEELRENDTPAGILFGNELKAKNALREDQNPKADLRDEICLTSSARSIKMVVREPLGTVDSMMGAYTYLT